SVRRSRMSWPAVALIDETQSLEGEHLVDFGDVLRLARDEVREAAGGDAFCLRAEFGDHALEDRVDEAEVSPEEADLQVVDGVRPDDFCWAADLDAGQARSAREQCFGGDVESGRDGAAEEFAFSRDDVEVRCGAHVDDDGGAAVFVEGADTIRDTVCADLGGIVCEDRQAGFDAGLDEDWLVAEVALAELAKDPVDGRNDGGDDDAADGGAFDAFVVQEILDEDAVFVGGLALARGDAPVGAETSGEAVGA